MPRGPAKQHFARQDVAHPAPPSSLEKPYLTTPTASTTSQFTIRPCHRPRHTQHSAPSRAPTAVSSAVLFHQITTRVLCSSHNTHHHRQPADPNQLLRRAYCDLGTQARDLGRGSSDAGAPISEGQRSAHTRRRSARIFSHSAARAHKRAAAAHQRVAGITAQCSRHRSCSQLHGTQRRACSSISKAATAAGACASLAPSSAPRNQASHLKQSAMLLGLTDLYHRNTAASNNTTTMTTPTTIPHCPPAPRC